MLQTNRDVTILIPNFNGSKYLEAAIESCLQQTMKCAVIVIDNSSTDNSIEIINRYINHSDFQLLHQKTKGISAALNLGIANVHSEFIARLDADDIMEKDRIEKQFNFMVQNSEYVIVGSQIRYMDSQGNVLGSSNYPTTSKTIRKYIARGNPLAHPAVMYRNHDVKSVGGYRDMFNGAEDLDLWFRLLEIGEATNLPLTLTNYRIHPDQVSQKNNLALQELSLRKHNLSRFLVSQRYSICMKLLYLIRYIDLFVGGQSFFGKNYRRITRFVYHFKRNLL